MSGAPAGTGQLIGHRLGKYEVLALLALGGTAEIYLARIDGAAGFEKYVVVKCLHDHLADDAEFVRMFLDEARLAAQLDHSNIVQTFELGEYQGRYFMAMEFLAGLSLAMIVRRVTERVDGGRLPLPLILNLCAQTCAGLHYAHERQSGGKPLNVVHRDVSPQNLVIGFEGVVKIVDFGIARAEQRETKTRAGTIKGKFAYMSPEQCVSSNIDRRTDVFALGVILHELVTGKRLFKRANQYDTYQAVIECSVPPPSALVGEVDPALDRVVMGALAKEREERYPTAEAFGEALQRLMHERAMFGGPAEIAKFFDRVFAQEIEEHGARMRELIAGRELASDPSTGVNWDAEPSEEGELPELLLRTVDAGDGDDAPAPTEEGGEKTRIEMNPLEAVLAAEAARTEAAAAAPTAATRPPVDTRFSTAATPVPLPAPPTGPLRPSVDPLARTQERPRPPELDRAIAARAQAGGAAPEPPTVAYDKPRAKAPVAPAMPPTGGVIAAASFPDAKTELGVQLPPLPELAPTALVAEIVPPTYGAGSGGPVPSSGDLLVAPPGEVGIPAGSGPMPMMGPGGPPMMGPGGPLMMGPGGPPMMGPGGPPMMGPGGPPMMGPGGPPMMGPGGPPMMGPGGPLPMGPGGYPLAGGMPGAAHLVSPAPGGFHGDVDLAQLADRPIRRVPAWLLAIFFIGAIGVALLFTILIARAVR